MLTLPSRVDVMNRLGRAMADPTRSRILLQLLDEPGYPGALADQLGLDSAWIAEAWGQDAVSVLAVLADRTEQIGLGSGLMQIPARPPAATAMAPEAATRP